MEPWLCFFYFANRYTMELFLGQGCVDQSRLERRMKHVVDLVLRGIAYDGVENGVR